MSGTDKGGRAAAAIVELDALLALARTGVLDDRACARMVELSGAVPGRVRHVAAALARQRDAAAVEALRGLPAETPGVVEGLFGAVRHGVVRRRLDGAEFPHMIALEFRSSSSRRFPRLLARASAAFGHELERIRVGSRLHYRVAVIVERPPSPRLAARVASFELDLEALHRDLARIRGVRLWLNGWCFDDHSPIRPRARVPLLHAWFEWLRAVS